MANKAPEKFFLFPHFIPCFFHLINKNCPRQKARFFLHFRSVALKCCLPSDLTKHLKNRKKKFFPKNTEIKAEERI
jgi:hypothetical protein